MSEEEKYIKKRNTLLIIFMILLLIFVGFICYIFIYAKAHPKKEYIDPETIVITEMIKETNDFTMPNYIELTESSDFVLLTDEEEIELFVENNTVKCNKNDLIEKVVFDLNGNDINGNIKYIYQRDDESIILTTDGLIYKLLNNTIEEGNIIKIGQILNNQKIKNIIELEEKSEYIYAINESNEIINVLTGDIYNGVIMKLKCNEGVLYIFNDYSFGYDQTTHFVDGDNNPIKFNIVFESKLYDESGKIYELDFTNQTLTNSKLDKMTALSYAFEDNIYTIRTETTTGWYSYTSSYYYVK